MFRPTPYNLDGNPGIGFGSGYDTRYQSSDASFGLTYRVPVIALTVPKYIRVVCIGMEKSV